MTGSLRLSVRNWGDAEPDPAGTPLFGDHSRRVIETRYHASPNLMRFLGADRQISPAILAKVAAGHASRLKRSPARGEGRTRAMRILITMCRNGKLKLMAG